MNPYTQPETNAERQTADDFRNHGTNPSDVREPLVPNSNEAPDPVEIDWTALNREFS